MPVKVLESRERLARCELCTHTHPPVCTAETEDKRRSCWSGRSCRGWPLGPSPPSPPGGSISPDSPLPGWEKRASHTCWKRRPWPWPWTLAGSLLTCLSWWGSRCWGSRRRPRPRRRVGTGWWPRRRAKCSSHVCPTGQIWAHSPGTQKKVHNRRWRDTKGFERWRGTASCNKRRSFFFFPRRWKAFFSQQGHNGQAAATFRVSEQSAWAPPTVLLYIRWGGDLMATKSNQRYKNKRQHQLKAGTCGVRWQPGR